MAFSISLSLCWICLSVSVLRSAAYKEINTTAGQNVILTCRAPSSNNIIVVEWSRADMKEEYVLMYRDGHFDSTNQHPSFKNRVNLQDRQMKDGDVSLTLKDVTSADNGRYECRIIQTGANRRKRAYLKTPPSGIISLSVVDPPGHKGGQSGDGGEEAGVKESGSVGLIVGLSVLAVLIIVGVGAGAGAVFIYRPCRRRQSPDYQPPEDQGL